MIRRKVLALAIGGLMFSATQAATITVTTFVDENGENPNSCSLREAIKASELKSSYGGCSAGKRAETDVIQLKAGTYILDRGELVTKTALEVRGADSIDINARDSISGLYNSRLPLTTTIQATNNSRIFNTAVHRTNLRLQDVILTGGRADGIRTNPNDLNGGAIRAGATLTLERTVFRDNQAVGQGGAVYLEGTQSTLSASNTTFEQNNAPQGAVLSMSCLDNLLLTKRGIDIKQASITNNGSNATQSILDFCGVPTVDVIASTLGQNQVSSQSGSGVLRILDDGKGTRTSSASVLRLTSTTLAEPQGGAALVYDGHAALIISNSILAFNQNFDCRYIGGNELDDVLQVATVFNLIGGNRFVPTNLENAKNMPLSDTCQIPSRLSVIKYVETGEKDENDRPITKPELDLDKLTPAAQESRDNNRYTRDAQRSELLLPLADYGANLKGYLPNPTVFNTLDSAGKPMTITVVDAGHAVNQCGGADQRGVDRASGIKNKITNDIDSPRCDIGALELGQLTVNDDGDAVNGSYVEQLESKRFNFTDQQFANLTKEEQELVERITADETEYKEQFKQNFSYRRVFADVFINDIPQEKVSANATPSSSEFIGFYTKQYEVEAKSFGSGEDVLLTGRDLAATGSGNTDVVKCEWLPEMQRIVIYRTDGGVTRSGEVERCQYTVTSPDGVVVSTGVVQARIVNIRPVAENDTYTLRFGEPQLTFNILENDHDNGDGLIGSDFEPVDRTAFFEDRLLPESQRVNIKIKTPPQLGRLVFEREAPCPDNVATRPQQTCYGGKVTYLVKNTFSPFNDSFKYVVLDADKAESNEATVNIINTATTTEDTRKSGGSLGWLGVLGLMGLAGLATRRRRLSV
ncbi:MAG: WGxxGxxG family protein [Pseudomonadota bacterium]|nr:WGxxGxxG family protein [Pseudomonadota bacterium]